MNSRLEDHIKALFQQLHLGVNIKVVEAITGGLMHSMYRVESERGIYAVKHLNPAIMKRKGVLNHITNSEKVAINLKNTIPLISANTYEGKHILEIAGNFFIVFDWLDGASIFPPHITIKHCQQIGDILGKLHTIMIDFPEMEKESESVKMYPFKAYLESGIKEESVWVDELRCAMDQLNEWNIRAKSAKEILSERLVLSHRDLDPKNVMWHKSNPVLIDWEAAGYVNPNQELIEVINYWCDDNKGGLELSLVKALLAAYKKHLKVANEQWLIAIDCGYAGMLGWLNYSFKRSLGIEAATEEERQLGTEHVIATIEELRDYEKKSITLQSWLE